jgi:hypothetical protein
MCWHPSVLCQYPSQVVLLFMHHAHPFSAPQHQHQHQQHTYINIKGTTPSHANSSMPHCKAMHTTHTYAGSGLELWWHRPPHPSLSGAGPCCHNTRTSAYTKPSSTHTKISQPSQLCTASKVHFPRRDCNRTSTASKVYPPAWLTNRHAVHTCPLKQQHMPAG